MILWAVRHKRTGKLMPLLRRQGYSNWNPDSPEFNPIKTQGVARLFKDKKSANMAIGQWSRGRMIKKTFPERSDSLSSGGYDYYSEIVVEDKSDKRKKEDLEAVEMLLFFRGEEDETQETSSQTASPPTQV